MADMFFKLMPSIIHIPKKKARNEKQNFIIKRHV